MDMNKYMLMVMEELKNDKYFYLSKNFLRYEIPKDGEKFNIESARKVMAVYELRDRGAFKIHNQGEERIPGILSYVFEIIIIHPAFNGIYQKLKNELTFNKEQNKFNINQHDYLDPDKTKWFVDKASSKGSYIKSPDEKFTVRSGRFGGINELIKNSGHEITGEALKFAIKRNLQKGDGQNLNITQWKYDLERETEFSKFFYLDFKKPSYYRLYLLKK